MEPRRKKDGALLVEARVARPGIYKYHRDGETIRELVPRQTLYDPDSLKTLGRATYTDGHPPELVNKDNVDEYQAGDVGETITVDDDGFVRVTAAIRTKEAIENALSGKRSETSPGYKADVVDESGTHPEFGEYDAVQKSREYNHLAGVSKARGGSDCAIRTDSDDTKTYLFLENSPEWRLDSEHGHAMDLPLASRDRDWDGDQARQNLQDFYEFDPAEEETPEAYASNFAASPPMDSDAFNSVSNFWGPFVDVIDGERRIVPNAIIALQNAVQGARSEPDFPEGVDKSDVESAVSALWDKAWNKFGEEDWPAEEPTFDREDSADEEAEEEQDVSDLTVEVTPMDAEEIQERLDALMAKLEEKFDGEEDEDAEVLELFDAVSDELDEKAELESRLDRLEGRLDVYESEESKKDEKDEDESEPAIQFDSREELAKYQAERDKIRKVAKALRVDLSDEMSNEEMKKKIVEEDTDKDLDDASEERIDGAYDVLRDKTDFDAIEEKKASEQTKEAFEETPGKGEEKAQKDFRERLANQ